MSPATRPCSSEEGLLEALIKRSRVLTSLEIIDILSNKWASINLQEPPGLLLSVADPTVN